MTQQALQDKLRDSGAAGMEDEEIQTLIEILDEGMDSGFYQDAVRNRVALMLAGLNAEKAARERAKESQRMKAFPAPAAPAVERRRGDRRRKSWWRT